MPQLVPLTMLGLGGLYAIALGALLMAFELKLLAFTLLGITLLGCLILPLQWSLCLFFLYMGIEGCLKIFSDYNPIIHIGADLISLLLCVKVVIEAILLRREIPRSLPPFSKMIFAHFGWFIIAFFNPYSLSLYASAAGAKIYVTMVILFFFGYYATRSLSDVKKFMSPWVITIIVQVIFSIYQSSVGPSSVLSVHSGYAAPLKNLEGYAFRPFGLTALPGAPSVFIFLGMPFLWYFMTRKKGRVLLLPLALITLTAIATLFLCQVRSGIIKAAIGTTAFLLLSLFTRRREQQGSRSVSYASILAVIGILAVGVPFALEAVTSTYSDNMRAIERSMSVFDYGVMKDARRGGTERFVELLNTIPLGAGLSRTGAASGKFKEEINSSLFFSGGFFTDNFWIATLVDLGIPGMILITAIVFAFLIYGFRAIPRFQYQRYALAHIAILSSLGASVLGFYGAESILYNPEACFFWFFSGVLMKIPELDATDFLEELRREEMETIHESPA